MAWRWCGVRRVFLCMFMFQYSPGNTVNNATDFYTLHFCKLHGWHFKLITELEIHTDYLCNVRFLLPYQQNGLSGEYSEAYMTLLDESLRELKKSTPKQLIQQTFQDEYNQAKLLPVLWYLIAERKIGADLNQPLTMQSAIWFKK